jgi:hypothetical protein
MRHKFLIFVISIVLALTTVGPSLATTFDIDGKPMRVMGLINQGIGWGIAGDHFDTKEGFQSAIFDVILEADYTLSPELRLFGVGMLTGDWAYPILSDNDEWTDKQFDESREELYLDTDFNDLLQEFHLTWTPGNSIIRVGKQIVVWGETDGFRVMDQINPLDQRRGLSDVEFESTVLPIWLVRAEQYWQPDSSWLQDLGLELVFNPNAKFEPDRPIVLGNDEAGIWAPNVEIGPVPVAFDPVTGAPVAFLPGRLGSFIRDIEERDEWDSDGMEIGVRLRMVINDSIVTLNYFNGIDNSPAIKAAPAPPQAEVASDGSLIVHLPVEGFYPRLRFAGLTLTRDFPGLNVPFLGGVAPVLRLEGFYAFDSTFTTEDMSEFVKHDDFRYVVGVDWKVKIPFLNERAYFLISPQFYHRKIIDYPSAGLNGLEDDNYQTSIMINTTYFHNKIIPSVFWLRDITNHSNFFKYAVDYEYTDKWKFTLGALFFDGSDEGKGFEPLDHKDQIFATVSYKF